MSGVWEGPAPLRTAGLPGAPLRARILEARGLGDAAAAALFLDPKLTQLHDPALIPDLDKAARRILAACGGGEPVVIYGDYDVDGVSATAILFHLLTHLYPNAAIGTYVPHRIDEGYGLSSEAIRSLAAGGARVIVSVDCGITAIEPARVARECGLDLIITDHHNPPASLADLPDAYAVVHPRRPDSTYPFGDLSGSAVAFKLAWRLASLYHGVGDEPGGKVPVSTREVLLEMLGLASLGVIADIVPLVGENRVLARFGLSRIRDSKIPGLRALVEASGLAGERVAADDVGFRLGPRLNACGRLGHAKEAVELLTVARGERADAIARQLSELNDERRRIERRIADEACELAERAGMTGDHHRAIVLAAEGWHAGVIGIACSRLVDRYSRPVILLARSGDDCHGSGRSIDGFNLHGALEACREHLSSFGGHDMAAGLRVSSERFDAFARAFIGHANAALAPDDLVKTIRYDTYASLDELSAAAVSELSRLAPFGRENPGIRVRLTGLRVQGKPRPLGADGRHASLVVRSGGVAMRLIGWNWWDRLANLPTDAEIEAIVEPKVSSWTGAPCVEGELADLRTV